LQLVFTITHHWRRQSADCRQKLYRRLYAPMYNRDKQDLILSLIVEHVQFFSWADGCSTRCDLFNLVPRCPVSRCQSPQFWWSRVFSRLLRAHRVIILRAPELISQWRI